MHNKTIFVEKGLRDKIPQGKKVITDRVYGNQAEPEDYAKLSLPNPMSGTGKFQGPCPVAP
jgi:hypothetical protein